MTQDFAPEGVDELPGGDPADWGPLSSLPGNPMMWILIGGEMAVFGALLVGCVIARGLAGGAFAASEAHLHPLLAGANTVILVSSGAAVALAVAQRRAQRRHRVALLAGVALGIAFLAVKTVEYGQLIDQGIGIETNAFFRLYFLTTGFHAMHIVFGIVVLLIVCVYDSIENTETGAAFWHMLDMIWMLIYPVFYLMR